MVRNTTPGRILGSAFLLTLIVMQWCFGFMFFRQVYFVEVSQDMTAEEHALAEVIDMEYGFRPGIRIHRDLDLSYLNTLGYGAPFVAEYHERGQSITFTLNESTPTFITGEILVGGDLHDTARDQEARLCAERLFSPLTVPEFQYFPSVVTHMTVERYTSTQHLVHLCNPEILAPPPRLA